MYVKNKGQTRTGSVYYGSSRSTPTQSRSPKQEVVTAVNPNPTGKDSASVMPPPNYHGTAFSEERSESAPTANRPSDRNAVPVQETPAPAPSCGENARSNIPQSPAQPIPDIRQNERPDVPRRIRQNTPTRQSPLRLFQHSAQPAPESGSTGTARAERPDAPNRPDAPDGSCTCVPCRPEPPEDSGCRIPPERGCLSDIPDLLRRMGTKLSSDELLLWGMIILLLGQGGDEWVILALLWLLFA